MFLYGFELEGFLEDKETKEVIPPNSKLLPLDGFPGLIELRTVGGQNLEKCWSDVCNRAVNLGPVINDINFSRTEHKFSGADMQYMRKELPFLKDHLNLGNIYGKAPRRQLKTLAAFQINISNQIAASYTTKEGNFVPASYGLFDILKVVRNLDNEFMDQIKAANRQPGMYAIKEKYRLEYRSLPNSVFTFDKAEAVNLLARIKKAVEE